MEENKAKKKIAILGGGMASLTAALELTNRKDWQNHYEITLYQMGWRLGGKTATGRGPKDRIEEHGIHIFQGWYDYAFNLIQEVYKERKKKKLAPDNPYQNWEDVFDRNDSTFLTYYSAKEKRWRNWPMIFPRNRYKPGTKKLPFLSLLWKVAALFSEFLLGSPFQKVKGKEKFRTWLLRKIFFNNIDKNYSSRPEIYNEKDVDKTASSNISALQNTRTLIGFSWVMTKGLIKDAWSWRRFKFDYTKLNKFDFREWLKKNGASERVLESVLVRFAYTGTFSNIGTGDTPGGAISAGVAVQFFLQSIGYKGSFVWQFKLGTGESMITPVYEVLKARGVQFKFFHKVEQVHYSETGEIERIDMGKQVNLAVDDYNPLYKVKGINCWPEQPLYEQIDPAQAKKLQEEKINLESPWAKWEDVAKLQLQKGKDFDQIILGIPVGALKTICSGIIANNQKWKDMVTNVKTVPTQSVQLWLKPDLQELGLHLSQWGMAHKNCLPNAVTYADSMYSWLDSSLVLAQETWAANNAPKMIAYYTGSWKANLAPFSDHSYQDKENERLKESFRQWLDENMGFFWSDAVRKVKTSVPEVLVSADGEQIVVQGESSVASQGDAGNKETFDYDLLISPQGVEVSAKEKYDSQFFRANVSPTDQYTLSLPGTDEYRLKADESGFSNLFLTGDWTNFGLNVGYIEGTIISGYRAAHAVLKTYGLKGKTKVKS